jgi:hypothetical protein
MADVTVVGDQLNFVCDQGAVRSLGFTCQDDTGTAINLTGIVLEFVAEALDKTKVVSILTTDVSNPMGSVVVTDAVNGKVTLSLTAIATSAMYNSRGGYVFWSLWYQPGSGTSQALVDGQITVRRVAQA